MQPRRELLHADLHYRKLENLYAEAPVTRWYGATIRIEDGAAEVRIPVREEFLHAAGAVHGSVYFRAVDDAAFFAANSRVDDALLLTSSFHLHFTRPVDEGVLVATGNVVHEGGRLLVAEAELRDDAGRLLARGTGTFTRSLIALSEEVGYRLPAGAA
ncbi:MAG: hotdog fold thioesterase [Gemmatimonadetes bacterium]|nr:PaaI family thioesterase [Gemmatimonadota bacterium]NIR80179.1 PaaI family thioesterase [Gemmatimonadota bacterium]NIT88941.1 PaaI family thioesterase [Gemmatimonadota bacterium]NIU32736.1 PaaI family thioesterase [Gemmatimonadota bacterium]NIU37168.1 hotdog fold thioesterase [Gemmatimonadota bacterium]